MNLAGQMNVKLFFYLLVSLIVIPSLKLSAQDIDVSTYKEKYQLAIKKATGPVKIDAVLDEQDWQMAAPTSDFWLKFPNDNSIANHKTVVKVTYDDRFIYLGFAVYDSLPLIGQSLKRDSRIRESDGVGIILDPTGNKTNGFYFSVTAFNVQADDQFGTNSENLSFSWDNKWYSETKSFADHYIVEVAIPFKAIRYDSHKSTWGINFIRSDKKANEFHTWTRIPVNFPGTDLGYLGSLVWDALPPKAGNNISIIPYSTGGLTENKQSGKPIIGDIDAGFDAKIALNSSLNLDLTLNPDFSQVEVDRQVTNISRFNIFFPERRNFFLENSDLFSDYGTQNIRPFYSRRIGLDPDGNQIPIIGGLRLSGNVAARTRVGLMSMQTKSTENYAGQNYSALTFQQQLLKRSTFKAYFFNRQAFADTKHDLKDPLEKYGRNAGGEFAFNSEKGNWRGWLGYHLSMKDGVTGKNSFINSGGGYFGRSFSSSFSLNNVSSNYYADIGFIQRIENYDARKDTIIRLGFKQVFNQNSYRIYPKKGKVNQHRFQFQNFFVFNPDNSLNESNHELNYSIEMKNTSGARFEYSKSKVNLLYFTRFTNGEPLPPGEYNYDQASASFSTDSRKKFSFESGITFGKYYTADYLQYRGSATFRTQPWLTIQLNVEYNKLNFPEPYGKEDLFLVASRIEINFNTKIFWTTFLQYNTQRNNFNINSRLQWRYKPASDLFLVYTDNYFSDPFLKNKNRAIVFKLNYWLNL